MWRGKTSEGECGQFRGLNQLPSNLSKNFPSPLNILLSVGVAIHDVRSFQTVCTDLSDILEVTVLSDKAGPSTWECGVYVT